METDRSRPCTPGERVDVDYRGFGFFYPATVEQVRLRRRRRTRQQPPGKGVAEGGRQSTKEIVNLQRRQEGAGGEASAILQGRAARVPVAVTTSNSPSAPMVAVGQRQHLLPLESVGEESAVSGPPLSPS